MKSANIFCYLKGEDNALDDFLSFIGFMGVGDAYIHDNGRLHSRFAFSCAGSNAYPRHPGASSNRINPYYTIIRGEIK